MDQVSPLGMAAPSPCPPWHGHERPQHVDRGRTRDPAPRTAGEPAMNLDHFVERDGLRFAGTHLIVDLWKASRLDDVPAIEAALREAASAAGATLLKIDLHRFTPNGGVTGVAILAESHISIHTWPECAFAAVDVFMCGEAQPHKAIDVLRRAFTPGMLSIAEHRRGVMP